MAPPGDRLVVSEGSPLFAALDALARDARLVFFAGLPGTGKSVLIHQLAHLAHARGRRVHLLQWDVARPVFEASSAGRRYPPEAGVTHAVIRIAVGRWARVAVTRWHARHPGPDDVLIGETPLIGHRLIELARPGRDEAEPVLRAVSTRFVIPVPSAALREHLESERARRGRRPLHHREREDAPTDVLRALWRDLVAVAAALGMASPVDRDTSYGQATSDKAVTAGDYDPVIYQGVYERVLAHRHAQAVAIETRLPLEDRSAYDFAVPVADVVPTEDDVARFVEEVEAQFSGRDALQREIDGWYRLPAARAALAAGEREG